MVFGRVAARKRTRGGEPKSAIQNKTMTYSALVCTRAWAQAFVCKRRVRHRRRCCCCCCSLTIFVFCVNYHPPFGATEHTHTMNDWLTDPIILAYSLRWYVGTRAQTFFSSSLFLSVSPIQYATPSLELLWYALCIRAKCTSHREHTLKLLRFDDDYLLFLLFLLCCCCCIANCIFSATINWRLHNCLLCFLLLHTHT